MYDNTKGRSATASLELASTAKTRFEEFLRRQLGVSDAKDPEAVVSALRRLYPTAAARLEEEKQGVPIRFNTQPELPAVAMDGTGETAGVLQARTVREALEADLSHVMEHPSNRDFKGALSGWRDAVLAEWAEGLGAASLGADPTQRDRTFYSVRKLGDYARVARMVSLVNPDLAPEYRRLASTLDEAGMVLRVRAGEALFRAGFAEGGAIFQVALQDLRRRRGALISSLERFTTASTEDSADWGDGEASYGALLRELADQGQQDLRSLIQPQAMSRLLDVLLESVEQQSQPESLQELAATAPIELLQLKRLRTVAAGLLAGQKGAFIRSASAPLSAFVQSLHLFIEAFARPGASVRLLDLSIPFPFAVSQIGRPDPEGRSTVRELIRLRSELASEQEALFTDPDFDPLQWRGPVRLDRALYDVDRAIDLYLLGSGTRQIPGNEERRAALYGMVFRRWLETTTDWPQGDMGLSRRSADTSGRTPGFGRRMRQRLEALVGLLELDIDGEPLPVEEREQFLADQRALEVEWSALAQQLARPNASRLHLLTLASNLFEPFDEGTPVLELDFVPEVPQDPRASLVRIADAVETAAEPDGVGQEQPPVGAAGGATSASPAAKRPRRRAKAAPNARAGTSRKRKQPESHAGEAAHHSRDLKH